MNVWGGIAGAIIGGATSLYKSKRQNDHVVSAYKEFSSKLIFDYNYNLNEIDKASVNARDQIKNQLFQLSSNAYRNNAMVENAVLQSGVEGRSSNQIIRDVKGQTIRQKEFAIDNYEQTLYNLDSKANDLYIRTKQTIKEGRDMYQDQILDATEAFLQSIPASLQGFAIGSGMGSGASAFSGAMKSGAGFGASMVKGFEAFKPYMQMASYAGQANSLFSTTNR